MKEDESLEQSAEPKEPEITYDLNSVKEAARFLRVSETTVWRYADQDILPAYRVGRKRVMFRRGDLEALQNNVRRKKQPVNTTRRRLRLMAMSEGADKDARAVMTRATALREDILAGRGGVALGSSWEDIDEAREERSRDL
jgi:excisionase family DNA binding protein